jgi:DNA-binding transcriptional ArsR family regulator
MGEFQFDLDEVYVPQVTFKGKRQRSVNAKTTGVPYPRWLDGEFFRGPMPLPWFGRASALGGKALPTALAVWFEAGRRGRLDNLKMTGKLVARLGVSPSSKSRALKALQEAGLIHVERRGRKNPLVTILGVEAGSREDPAG